MRQILSNIGIENASKVILDKTFSRLKQKGYGSFINRHETLGVIQEEKAELDRSCSEGTLEEFKEELLDIAVACLIGYASAAFFDHEDKRVGK